ncbi:Copine-1 [Geodia barretti]|uniref:Copine-3 n=1 Tax=Geodia barretti TaxID=519541 RepID=A0AA35TSG2_GEOBA|nr:Copine-1 [Geodia barretti]
MAAYPPVVTGPASRVELRISCKGLFSADFLSKSDPRVIVQTADSRGAWTECGRTETIKNQHNPQFVKAIEMTYQFECVQKMRFEVYDVDDSALSPDYCLGYMECTLAEIVSLRSLTKKLTNDQITADCGTITIAAEEISGNNQLLELQFSAKSLDKKDFLGKSDPYLDFARQNPDGTYSAVHRIPHVLKTLNPHWPAFKVQSRLLCGGDPSRSVRVRCYDWDEASSPDLIGEFFTTMAEMGQAAEGKTLEWEAIHPEKKRKKKNYKKLWNYFTPQLQGCQINFTIGIDFTGSNGNPRNPTSLHYINPSCPNEYTMALWAVGGVCQDYDTDKLFPAFGFGAKVGGKVSHEFPLNGEWDNPYCAGIQGVVQAYHQSLQTAELYGPTNVAPIINHVAHFAAQAAGTDQQGPSTTQSYFILLLLTDGVLSDMMETKMALINASSYPMSVIIVGVGGADFSAMDELDSDDKLLRVGAITAERDICQFVPFRKYASGSPAAMASAVLAEVPAQVTAYFTKRGIPPLRMPPQ